MSKREISKPVLLAVLGGCAVLIVGVVLTVKAIGSLNDKDAQIAALKKDVKDLDSKRLVQIANQARYEQWRTISLPPDPDVAKSRYKLFLQELVRKHQMFLKGSITDSGHGGVVSTRGTTASFTPLTFNMTAEATLPKLIGFLDDFYSINLPHIIRNMSISRSAGEGEGRLDVTLKIEALSLSNATNRDFLTALPGAPLLAIDVFTALKGGPSGLALGPWLATPTGAHGARKLANRLKQEREYRQLVTKNVFVGLQPPADVADSRRLGADRDTLKWVQLTGITSNIFATEAWLHNRRTGKDYTLRAEGGFDSFEIHDRENVLVLKGTVKAVTERHVVILVGGKHYAVHIGAFLEESLAKALTPAELKEFGITAETAADTAAEKEEKPGEP